MTLVPVKDVASFLDENHYLGAAKRGIAWQDEFGVLVLANPTSRRLPQSRWLELTRWCLLGEKNAGSRQWARVARYIRESRPDITTVVSYSDPSVGHTGSLYRACNWLHAPTWQRLRPPPSGNGMWKDGQIQSVKDRWVFPLLPDCERQALLSIKDESLVRRGAVGYIEPKRFRVAAGRG